MARPSPGPPAAAALPCRHRLRWPLGDRAPLGFRVKAILSWRNATAEDRAGAGIYCYFGPLPAPRHVERVHRDPGARPRRVAIRPAPLDGENAGQRLLRRIHRLVRAAVAA